MFTKENAREMGSKGGRATVRKHGKQHMSQIGKAGKNRVVELYFDGDEAAFINWFTELGLYNYWSSTNIQMKRDFAGNPIWPESKPVHPANLQ